MFTHKRCIGSLPCKGSIACIGSLPGTGSIPCIRYMPYIRYIPCKRYIPSVSYISSIRQGEVPFQFNSFQFVHAVIFNMFQKIEMYGTSHCRIYHA